MKEKLTSRQHEIAELLAWGASAKEIALILGVSVNTVVRHIKIMKKKLGISKTTEISAFIFCTDYHVPVEYDRIGNIKKIVSMCALLILIAIAEFQQTDRLMVRTSAMRVARVRTARRVRREGYDECNIAFYATTLE